MKKISLLFCTGVLALGIISTSCDSKGTSAKLSTDVDSASYAIGIANGNVFKQQIAELPGEGCNIDVLIAGFTQAIKGDSTQMTVEQAQAYLQAYFAAASVKDAEKNKEAGKKFLEENKKKEGVQTTASGLQYKVLQEGNGTKPTAESTVKVNYKGTLIDGKEFDSSYKRGEPATFMVGGVIPGWIEGLQLMSPGAKYMFWIPSELGYGENGGGPIKPNSTLIFEVELLEILPPAAANAANPAASAPHGH